MVFYDTKRNLKGMSLPFIEGKEKKGLKLMKIFTSVQILMEMLYLNFTFLILEKL